MYKIDSQGSVGGGFVEENAATGRQATLVTAEWLNAVQGELVEMARAAGANLDRNNSVQVKQSLFNLLQSGPLITGGAGGTGDAITLTLPAGVSTLTNLQYVRFIAPSTNTVIAPTLNLTLDATPTGAKAIVADWMGTGLKVGDIQASTVVELVYAAALGKWVLVGSALRATTITNALGYAPMLRLGAGAALPSTNIGPIWHDDYASIMTWQTFSANNAAYTGYASVLIGSLLADTQPTARTGYLLSGANNLSRTTYAALRGWAMHNGIMVASATWAAGAIAIKDNADGTTFTAYDVRGEFPRFFDNGRGIDNGRGFGTSQIDAMQNIVGNFSSWIRVVASPMSGPFYDNGVRANPMFSGGGGDNSQTGVTFDASRVVRTATETHPRNTALLAAIKF